MTKVVIHEPIWKPPRSIGIAEDRLKTAVIEIEIDYVNKQGERIYPEPFYAYSHHIRSYPSVEKFGHTLYIVPIEDLRSKPV